MSRSRNKKSLNYGALENRCLLANSVFFLNMDTSTLHIQAGVGDDPTTEFVNDISFSIDANTNELVVSESDDVDRRFNVGDVDRISYRGTSGDDRFTNNTAISSRVVGFAGDDIITSGNGDDRVIAANGNDTVFPGDGNDYVAGGQGDDTILEDDSTGNDRFFGGPGADTIDGGAGEDFLAGHEGDDIIRGGTENDSIFGHDGIDQLFGGSGRDFIYGGNGDDQLSGDFGNDRLLGQDGGDSIFGGEGNDVALGGNGNDNIEGNAGDDRLIGNLGNDLLDGGVGADSHFAAAPTPNGASSGFDTVITGDDTDVDYVISHPFADAIDVGEDDRTANSETIRLNLQSRYLQQNISNPGWQETASGLQYRTIVSGTGATPGPTDRVLTNYVGTFTDGTQFDANDGISFGLNQVIAGWTEGLQLMNVGGTIELAIPAALAYGDSGTRGIPGGSTLLFRIDLLDIV